MKKSRLLGVLCTTLFMLIAGSASAAVVTVPVGLNPGDMYRLVFVTSSTRNATSTYIADYNAFVTGVANTQVELLGRGTTWSAIGSTSTVDARDNTGTNPSTDGAGVLSTCWTGRCSYKIMQIFGMEQSLEITASLYSRMVSP